VRLYTWKEYGNYVKSTPYNDESTAYNARTTAYNGERTAYNDESTTYKGLIPRAIFLGEMRNISPVSFEL
jgi:hypothetical protein